MTSLDQLFEDAVDPRTSIWDLSPQKRAEAAGIAEGQPLHLVERDPDLENYTGRHRRVRRGLKGLFR
jgi:hypothetical protein